MASSQCVQKSANGKRCKRMTLSTNKRCTPHQTSKESAKLFKHPTRDCMQCRAIINGKPCKRQTCGIKNLCAQHLKITKNLRKKGSHLFANADIAKGTVIDRVKRLNNPILSDQDVMNRYPLTKGKSRLVFNMAKDRNYDLNNSTLSSLARYIPDCDGPFWGGDRSGCNVSSVRSAGARPLFIASRNIPKNQMLRVPYGQEYFTEGGGNRKITDRRRSLGPRSQQNSPARSPGRPRSAPGTPARRHTLANGTRSH